MAGTFIGGKKAAEKNLAKDPDFYKKIGSKGGKNGNTGGFASNVECNCPEVRGWHYKRQCAGAKGGRISRRGTRKGENEFDVRVPDESRNIS